MRPRQGITVRNWGSAPAAQALLASLLASLVVAAHAQTPAADADAGTAPTLVQGRPAPQTDVFVANAPDTYVVVRGDTLWGIAGRFLKSPWRWPQVWQANRDQIRNPHWIYPGQTIVLDRATGTMRIGGAGAPGGTVRLEPQVRSEQSSEAIPSIPPEAIEPFLTQPLVVDTPTMTSAPRIVASRERVVLGAGDIAYVSGIVDPEVKNYQLFRPGRALVDPDTGRTIAYQADYLGTAEVTRPGDPATVAITTSKREISVGDRLVPASKPGIVNYMPHAPDHAIAGRVVSVYSGVAYAGPNMVVAINRGANDGIDVGTILAIRSFGRVVVDRTNSSHWWDTLGWFGPRVKLPEERKGLLFVFRVFDGVAYGLITSASDAVQVGDAVTQP